jgi:hypothetical protein
MLNCYGTEKAAAVKKNLTKPMPLITIEADKGYLFMRGVVR